jgi:hypothetical protein
MNGYHENRKKLRERTKKENAHTDFNMDTLADITFYKCIEKRGCLAWLKGVEMNWHDLQKYALRQMTEKNTKDWSRIQRVKLSERLRM